MAEVVPLTEQQISDLELNKDSDEGGQNAGSAEVHRWDRRAAADAIKRAEAELQTTNDPSRKQALENSLGDLNHQLDELTRAEQTEQQNLEYAKRSNLRSEETLANSTEQVTREQSTLAELERNLAEVSASITRMEQRIEVNKKYFKDDLLHNLDRVPLRTKIDLLLGNTSFKAIAQEKVYEDRVAEIMERDDTLTQEAAERIDLSP